MRRDLANCYQMHKTVLTGFPQKNERKNKKESARAQFDILYRIEESSHSNRVFLLVQSNIEPNWSYLPKWYTLKNNHDDGFTVKNLKDLPLQIIKKAVFRFKLRANPTRKKFDEEKEKGIRIPLVNEQDQIDWLLRKGTLHGFKILSMNQNIQNASVREQITYQGRKKVGEKTHILTFYSVVFEGLLEVANKEKFVTALKKGIGSGKSFGFGLITLARPY